MLTPHVRRTVSCLLAVLAVRCDTSTSTCDLPKTYHEAYDFKYLYSGFVPARYPQMKITGVVNEAVYTGIVVCTEH